MNLLAAFSSMNVLGVFCKRLNVGIARGKQLTIIERNVIQYIVGSVQILTVIFRTVQ